MNYDLPLLHHCRQWDQRRTIQTLPPAAAAAGSASKYSAARVRERFAHDGTVAPVTTPKKTQEGLYQRPAGRTRKGMEWDAVRGVWVPNDKSMAYYFY